jgi:hypothetical protein
MMVDGGLDIDTYFDPFPGREASRAPLTSSPTSGEWTMMLSLKVSRKARVNVGWHLVCSLQNPMEQKFRIKTGA